MTDKYAHLPRLSEKSADSAVVLTLAADLKKANIFPDITFKFSNEQEIPAHRFILARDSTYFNDFFTDNDDCDEIETSELKDFPDFETFIVYLHRLYSSNNIIKSFDEDTIGNIWYSLIDAIEYFNSNIRYPRISSMSMIALMNYSTNGSKFLYDNYEKYSKYFDGTGYAGVYHIEPILIPLCSYNSLWILLNVIWINRKVNVKNSAGKTTDTINYTKHILLERYDNFLPSDKLKADMLIYVASKNGITNFHNDKIKDVDIDALTKTCPYILFDHHLPDFVKKLKEIKK